MSGQYTQAKKRFSSEPFEAAYGCIPCLFCGKAKGKAIRRIVRTAPVLFIGAFSFAASSPFMTSHITGNDSVRLVLKSASSAFRKR